MKNTGLRSVTSCCWIEKYEHFRCSSYHRLQDRSDNYIFLPLNCTPVIGIDTQENKRNF